MLRNAPSSFEARVDWIRSRARKRLSGGSATARSLNTSTSVPPAPKVMIGPKIGSRETPIISSRPFGRARKGSIDRPLMRAVGCRFFTVSMMS
ncbi:MAG: hypothetical protein AW12_01773 [Candidatus Accumulibacter sp. BA-94]|nr:MAG: hypothetical protein AW12_01773 [Candidatus Accumulibacter sp. BA-94]